MKNLACCFLISAVAYGQTIASGPKFWDLGNRSTQVYFTYTGTVSSAVFHFGTTCSYGRTSNFVIASSMNAAWTTLLMSGKQLEANTSYCYKIVINGADALTAQTFKTLNEVNAQAPIAPAPVTWFATRNQEPAGTYNADVTYALCSDLPAALAHMAALTGSNNQRYVFEGEWRSIGCGNQQFLAPTRPSHTGKVLVYGVDRTTFPPGRVNPVYGAQMAKIWHNQEFSSGAGTNNFTVEDDCIDLDVGGEGGIFTINSTATSTVNFIQCRSNWPAHSATITVVAQTCAVNANSDVNFTVNSGHGVTAGMLIGIPVNPCSVESGILGGTGSRADSVRPYLVESVTATSIQMRGLKRKGSFANIVTPFTLTVKENWRQPTSVNSEVEVGAGAPSGTCDEHGGYKWYVESGTNTSWWCVDATGNDLASSTGKWRRFIPKSSGSFDDHAMLNVASSAKDYTFIGWEVIASALPNPSPPGMFFRHNLKYRAYCKLSMLGVGGSSQRIIFDRVWVHAEGNASPPIRIRTGLNAGSCSDCGVINSRFDDVTMWQPLEHTYTQADGAVFVSHSGGGPSLYRNNYFSGVGTTQWYTDPPEKNPFVHDSTLERNTFVTDMRFMNGHARNNAWDGTMYERVKSGTRNGPEIKKGARLFWGRNKFFGYFSTQTKGSFFILQNTRDSVTSWSVENITSISNGVVTMAAASSIDIGTGVVIAGSSNAAYNGLWLITAVASCAVTTDLCTALTIDSGAIGASTGGTMRFLYPGGRSPRDVDMRWNLITDGPEILTGVGPNVDSGSTANQNGRFVRMRVADNLCVNCNSLTYKAGDQGNPAEAGVRLGSLAYGFEHSIFNRNTFYSAGGSLPRLATSEATPASWALEMDDNVFHFGQVSAYTHLFDGNGQTKIAGLDYGWSAATGGWKVGRNAVCCNVPGSVQTGHPPGMIWVAATGDIQFTNPAATYTGRLKDYRLSYGSPYKSGGAQPSSYRDDLGVDIEQLTRELGDVKNVRVREVTGTTATLSYVAPKTVDTCYYQVSTNAAWGAAGTWTADSGGARNRNINITLTAGTVDYIRLACETQQFSCPETGGACTLLQQ